MKFYYAGDKPGKGVYLCIVCCKWRIQIDQPDQELPACSNCPRGTKPKYTRLGS